MGNTKKKKDNLEEKNNLKTLTDVFIFFFFVKTGEKVERIRQYFLKMCKFN